jgi:hypothetical protein
MLVLSIYPMQLISLDAAYQWLMFNHFLSILIIYPFISHRSRRDWYIDPFLEIYSKNDHDTTRTSLSLRSTENKIFIKKISRQGIFFSPIADFLSCELTYILQSNRLHRSKFVVTIWKIK